MEQGLNVPRPRLDGRLATWEFSNGVSVLRKDQSFDLAGRILGIADPNNPTASQTYQYDPLDRLKVAQSGNPVAHTQQFGYDELGNRQNATLDGTVTNLTYATASNQLQPISSVSPSYLNGATSLAFTYNNANRLVAIQSSGTTIAGLRGQRARAAGEQDDGRRDLNALRLRRAGPPTGRIRRDRRPDRGDGLAGGPAGGHATADRHARHPDADPNVFYVHADHPGSPRAVTRPADNAFMWQWDSVDPFGANVANENPSGQGVFRYGLRFPGQYYDAETGTHYNNFRDYDPAVGRYETE